MKEKLTEEQIDEIVAKEADDLSKWEAPIYVKAPQAISPSAVSDVDSKSQVFSLLSTSQRISNLIWKR